MSWWKLHFFPPSARLEKIQTLHKGPERSMNINDKAGIIELQELLLKTNLKLQETMAF